MQKLKDEYAVYPVKEIQELYQYKIKYQALLEELESYKRRYMSLKMIKTLEVNKCSCTHDFSEHERNSSTI